nr:family 78 glycoside hydrolase catalytic domain [Cellulosimicrobium arenosum]
MWQLNDEEPGNPKLRPHARIGGGWSLLDEISLTEAGLEPDVLTERGELEVTAEGGTVSTRVDGVLVDTRSVSLPRFEKGYVGFRTSASTTSHESVTVHSAAVEPLDGGDPLLDTDFDGQNPFDGGELVEDGLLLDGNHETLVSVPDDHPFLRTDLDLPKEVRSARVYASARGVYELSLNGTKVGDQQLAPGWTDYDTRIEYQTYDVTDLVRTGSNAFGAMLAPGWYAGRLAHAGDKNYGSRPSVIAQLRVDYSDGTSDTFGTDDDWATAPGPYAKADLIDGEDYVAGRERAGWDEPGYDDSAWDAVWVAPSATSLLEPQAAPPVRVTEELPARTRTEPEPGAWVYDLGQNMVGVARVVLRGEPGSTVRVRYGEETYPDGRLYTANLRSARATDYYTFDERGEAVYQPRFTFHGFRYVEVTGVTDPPTTDEVTGVVWGSDLERTGTLETSNELVNQLQSNITWGQRGNFLSIPTDTPARDERLGWSGDINVFAPTASFNMDTLAFLSKWLVDLQDAQLPNGDYNGVAPYHPDLACCGGGTGWSDAGITVPWTLWQSYGDTEHVRAGWTSMTRYMDYLAAAYPDHVRGSSYADWLNLDDPTPGDVLGTAYYAYVARQMSEMAEAIGHDDEAEHYASLAAEVGDVFRDHFVAADGTVTGDSQAGYAIAIGMGLITDEQMPAVAENFVATLERRDFHLSTGFLGTPWLVSSLAESGNLDVAYRVLLNEDYPSWGYEIANGATTVWERWNSIMPDGSFGDVSMNSFNHYAYGAVGDWMYRSIGGIAPGAPGYKQSVLAPTPGGGISDASARYDSVYGQIRTSWSTGGGDFRMSATVPANTTATVVLPTVDPDLVTEGGLALADVSDVTDVEVVDGAVRVTVGSGDYVFVAAGAGVVDPVVALDPVEVSPGTIAPGGSTEVRTTVTGLGTEDVTGHLEVEVPSGWRAPSPSEEVTVRARGSVDVPVTVTAPLEAAATSARAPLNLRFVIDDVTVGSASTEVGVEIESVAEVPAGYDHVDLGDATSEEAHDLTASPSSGTSTEAGLTRRYAGLTDFSFFEFDMAVVPGEPFVLRATETYDTSQTKRYTVYVDGEEVHLRRHRHDGAGTETYQVVVPAELATSDTVRVTFETQDDHSFYDPSIADTWTLPVPAGAVPELDVDVSAQSRCLAGKAYVAVRATNGTDVPLDVTLATPYGTKDDSDVQPGKSAYQSFAVRDTTTAAGTATVTATGTLDGDEVSVETDAPYDALDCG